MEDFELEKTFLCTTITILSEINNLSAEEVTSKFTKEDDDYCKQHYLNYFEIVCKYHNLNNVSKFFEKYKKDDDYGIGKLIVDILREALKIPVNKQKVFAISKSEIELLLNNGECIVDGIRLIKTEE